MLLALDDEQRSELIGQPEYGMGFQISKNRRTVFLNAELAIALPGEWHAIDVRKTMDNIQPWLVRFLSLDDSSGRQELLKNLDPYRDSVSVSEHSSYLSTTQANETFYRYSAFSPDRRVNLSDNSLLPNSYVTTEFDSTLVPSGLAAVGRYALPNRLPAIYRYKIQPSTGTQIYCGTSAPAFGQSGGGVEVRFLQNSGPDTVALPPLKVSDR